MRGPSRGLVLFYDAEVYLLYIWYTGDRGGTVVKVLFYKS